MGSFTAKSFNEIVKILDKLVDHNDHGVQQDQTLNQRSKIKQKC